MFDCFDCSWIPPVPIMKLISNTHDTEISTRKSFLEPRITKQLQCPAQQGDYIIEHCLYYVNTFVGRYVISR